jgi:hypothetical protein
MKGQRIKEDILELIPHDKVTPQQKAFAVSRYQGVRLYRFRREPIRFNEIIWICYHDTALWRDNGTFIFVSTARTRALPERHLPFLIRNVGRRTILHGIIYGNNDAAIAETATFFWSLKLVSKVKLLNIGNDSVFPDDDKFDVAAMQPEQLVKVLKANPKLELILN